MHPIVYGHVPAAVPVHIMSNNKNKHVPHGKMAALYVVVEKCACACRFLSVTFIYAAPPTKVVNYPHTHTDTHNFTATGNTGPEQRPTFFKCSFGCICLCQCCLYEGDASFWTATKIAMVLCKCSVSFKSGCAHHRRSFLFQFLYESVCVCVWLCVFKSPVQASTIFVCLLS